MNNNQHFIYLAAAWATGVNLLLSDSRKHLLRDLLRQTGPYFLWSFRQQSWWNFTFHHVKHQSIIRLIFFFFFLWQVYFWVNFFSRDFFEGIFLREIFPGGFFPEFFFLDGFFPGGFFPGGSFPSALKYIWIKNNGWQIFLTRIVDCRKYKERQKEFQ